MSASLSLYLATLFLLNATTGVHADVLFTLTPAVEYGVESNQVVFTGTLINTNQTEAVFLNGIQIDFSGIATSYLTALSNTFFANVPGILAPGATYSDVIFAVAIDTTTPPGDYFGMVSLQGGADILAAGDLATQPFQIVSSATAFGAWRLEEFGSSANDPAISGDLADPEGDGIANLLEYSQFLDPHTADATGLAIGELDVSCNCLALLYTKALSAIDVIYTIEGASDPNGPWTTNGITQSIIDADTLTLKIFARDAANPVTNTVKRFLHLKVTRVP